MKSKLYYSFLILLLTTPIARPNLSIAEQREILTTCLVPLQLKQKLDLFFAREDVREYMSIPRRFIFPWGNNRLTTQSLVQKAVYDEQARNNEMRRRGLLAKLVSTCSLHCYEGLNLGDSYTILTTPAWDGFLLKIPNVAFPRYPEIYTAYKLTLRGIGSDQNFQEVISTKTKYQNVSRVLMVRKIAEFIASEKLNLIKIPQKFIYPLPTVSLSRELRIDGVDYPEISDDDYIVVTQKMPISSAAVNKGVVVSMVERGAKHYEDFIKPEYFELFTQLVQVITYAGIWSVGPNNIFAVKYSEPQALNFVLIDLEKPGLGGSEDQYFFHKNPAEIVKNSAAGFDELCDWLNKQ